MDHLSGGESAARPFVSEEEADDNDKFVDIMSCITAVGDAEAEFDFCGCAGTCEFVNGDVGRECCRHISYSYVLVFFLHSPLALISKISMVALVFSIR